MKVVKIIGSLDFGGIEKVFEITARYYKGDKKDIVFLCLGHGGKTERVIRDMGYRVVVWNTPSRIPQIGLIPRLVRFIRRERPDVVHTTGAEANFHGIIAAYLGNVRVRVAEEIGMPDHSRVARLVFRGVYRMASRVIAVARLVEDFLVRSGESDKNRVEVIYNPVHLPVADPSGQKRTPEVFRMVSVCRLDPIKNLDLLIRSVSKVTVTAELWIVGEGQERARLEGLTRELGLEGRVTFWGFQPDPSGFLEGASVFVLPSFSEGISLAAAEAMLMGTPCAVTRVGGGPEFITNGENGWLLDPLDIDGFAHLVQQIANLPADELRAIGQRGRDTAIDKFEPRKYMQLVWNLYQSI